MFETTNQTIHRLKPTRAIKSQVALREQGAFPCPCRAWGCFIMPLALVFQWDVNYIIVRCGKPTLNEDHCPRNHGFQIYVSLPCGPWVSTCFFSFSITKRKKNTTDSLMSNVRSLDLSIYQWMWWGMLHCHLDYQRVLPGPRNSCQREIRESHWYFNDNPDVPFGYLK